MAIQQQQSSNLQPRAPDASAPPAVQGSRANVLMHLNAQALERLWEGQEEEGMSILQGDYHLGHGALLETQDITQTVPSEQSQLILTALSLEEILSPEQGPDEHNSPNELTPVNSANSQFTFYPMTFLAAGLPDYYQETAMSENILVGPVCAVLSYNLAVLYHQIFLLRGTSRSIGKAQRKYQQAHDLCQDHDLQLAIYNNWGHLCFMMGDTAQVQTCQEGLVFLTASLQNCNDIPLPAWLLSGQDVPP